MIGVIITGYGGPASLDEVGPFLSSIAGGRTFTPEQVEAARTRYREIGGKSPLNEITRKQADLLQRELNRKGINFLVKMGMLHLPPFITDVIEEIIDEGIDKLAVVTLAPFRSRVSTAAYFRKAEKALEEHGTVEAVYVEGWNLHPLFIQAAAEGINSVLATFPENEIKDIDVIFSIHSLPEKFIQEGDPYVDDIHGTVDKIIPLLHAKRHHIAFQSKGRGDNWLGPDTDTVMRKLKDENRGNAVIAPIGFISDHVETLYDIDITYKNIARELGITMKRVPAVNDSPLFISALADEITKATIQWI